MGSCAIDRSVSTIFPQTGKLLRMQMRFSSSGDRLHLTAVWCGVQEESQRSAGPSKASARGV